MKSKLLKTEGLVIRATRFGEGDKIFTVLTPEHGRLSVMDKAEGRTVNSKESLMVGTYMNFVFYKKDTMCWVRESEVKEPFMGVRSDIVASALSMYLMDVAYELSDDGQECYDILAITYNCLYALNYKEGLDFDLIKGAFELKAMSSSGYMPTVNTCIECGKLDTDIYLDVMNGGVVCASCLKKRENAPIYVPPEDSDFHAPVNILCPLTPSVLCAMLYVIRAPFSKMLSFTLEGEDELHLFESACKTYLLNHLERGFDSLKYYYTVKSKFKRNKTQKQIYTDI